MHSPSILTTGQLEQPACAIPGILTPDAGCFGRRSKRLRELAPGHGFKAYLLFLACLAESQQQALDQSPDLPCPDPRELSQRRASGLPLLPFLLEEKSLEPPYWQRIVPQLARSVLEASPDKGRKALNALLLAEGPDLLRQVAAMFQENKQKNCLPAATPILAAALQVQWSALALQTAAAIKNLPGAKTEPRLCPICGFPPTASLIHGQGTVRGLRYLYCALCNCQWHVVRAKCSQCGNTKGITYLGIQGKNWPVQAEACPKCNSYLKLCRLDQDSASDPLADDLATLALDLLMTGKGYATSGANLFLFPGQGG